jgi:hypothetical protein
MAGALRRDHRSSSARLIFAAAERIAAVFRVPVLQETESHYTGQERDLVDSRRNGVSSSWHQKRSGVYERNLAAQGKLSKKALPWTNGELAFAAETLAATEAAENNS